MAEIIREFKPDVLHGHFLGGAGIPFRSIKDVPAIITGAYPDAMRQRGYQNALKCDSRAHAATLLDCWSKFLQ